MRNMLTYVLKTTIEREERWRRRVGEETALGRTTTETTTQW